MTCAYGSAAAAGELVQGGSAAGQGNYPASAYSRPHPLTAAPLFKCQPAILFRALAMNHTAHRSRCGSDETHFLTSSKGQQLCCSLIVYIATHSVLWCISTLYNTGRRPRAKPVCRPGDTWSGGCLRGAGGLSKEQK